MNTAKLFVKQIPLTDIERLPENKTSTKNLFGLPLYYQYGVGSAGFGAWRELAVHKMTADWVLEDECPNFPLMYHWRILEKPKPKPMNDEQLEELEKLVKYWNNSPAIRSRLEAIHNASANIVVFLEYIPQTARKWLDAQLKENGDAADKACMMVDTNLQQVVKFINNRGLLHFDAHFDNILTDGKQLYLLDFGLAISNQFDLSVAEKDFFQEHQNYDRYSTATNLLHCIITSLFDEDDYIVALKEYVDGNTDINPPYVASLVKKYAATALTMDKFYKSLWYGNKATPYPRELLEDVYGTR